MQFTKIAALLLSVAAGVSAGPAPNDAMLEPFRLHARSCGAGLLRGNALKLCQQACKAACNLIPVPAANGICVKSCDAAPVKRDETEAEAEAEAETESESEEQLETPNLQRRACGLFTGKALSLCQQACSATCKAIPVEPVQKLCVDSCNAASLKVREPEPVAAAPIAVREPAPAPAPYPITGGQVCRGACAVTCNSTVLALIQKKCLEVCNGKCPK